MASAGRILIMPKGEWNAETEYEMLDLVYHNGTSWLAKKGVVGIEPSNNADEWQKVVDVDEVVNRNNDKEWTYPVLNDEKFRPYQGRDNNRVRYRKYGNVVYIRGSIEVTAVIEGDSITKIFDIGSAYCPKEMPVYGIMQGSEVNKWSLMIKTDGTVNIQRYGTTEKIDIPVGTWLNIDISYPLD
jgi:hypothetical protein